MEDPARSPSELTEHTPRLEARPQAREGLARAGPCLFAFPRDTPQYNCECPHGLIFFLFYFFPSVHHCFIVGRDMQIQHWHPKASQSPQCPSEHTSGTWGEPLAPSSQHLTPRGSSASTSTHRWRDPGTRAGPGSPPALSAPVPITPAPHSLQKCLNRQWKPTPISTLQAPPASLAYNLVKIPNHDSQRPL